MCSRETPCACPSLIGPRGLLSRLETCCLGWGLGEHQILAAQVHMEPWPLLIPSSLAERHVRCQRADEPHRSRQCLRVLSLRSPGWAWGRCCTPSKNPLRSRTPQGSACCLPSPRWTSPPVGWGVRTSEISRFASLDKLERSTRLLRCC